MERLKPVTVPHLSAPTLTIDATCPRSYISGMSETASFLCFAHGRDGDWEAVCVDLDIAIQGSSFDEVRNLLNRAVSTYVADAEAESPEVRDRLLSRRAPWYVTAGLKLRFLISSFTRRRDSLAEAMFPVYAAPQMHFSAISGYN